MLWLVGWLVGQVGAIDIGVLICTVGRVEGIGFITLHSWPIVFIRWHNFTFHNGRLYWFLECHMCMTLCMCVIIIAKIQLFFANLYIY